MDEGELRRLRLGGRIDEQREHGVGPVGWGRAELHGNKKNLPQLADRKRRFAAATIADDT